MVAEVDGAVTRGHVALSGSFGYELDLNRISEEEKAMVREQIREFHDTIP